MLGIFLRAVKHVNSDVSSRKYTMQLFLINYSRRSIFSLKYGSPMNLSLRPLH